MDAAKTRRRELAPRRVKKQRAVADAFKTNVFFAPGDQQGDAAERINIEQIRSIQELHATTPSLRRCLESTLSSVFADRGLVMTTADQTVVELDETQRLYISECWLEPLRRAAAQLVMFGCTALDTEPIGSAHTASAFLALARSTGGPGIEAVARKNPKLVVLKLEDVRWRLGRATWCRSGLQACSPPGCCSSRSTASALFAHTARRPSRLTMSRRISSQVKHGGRRQTSLRGAKRTSAARKTVLVVRRLAATFAGPQCGSS